MIRAVSPFIATDPVHDASLRRFQTFAAVHASLVPAHEFTTHVYDDHAISHDISIRNLYLDGPAPLVPPRCQASVPIRTPRR